MAASDSALIKHVHKGYIVGTVYLTAVSMGRDRFGEDYHCCAIADDGTVLGTHICSTPGYMRHDLTGTQRRRDALRAHFGGDEGEAYEVVDCGDQLPPAEVVARNHQQGEGVSDGD